MNTPSEEKVSSGVKDGSSADEVTQGVTRGGGRIRRATFADLDAILDINDNIYDGLDYMPAYFYIFMHSKNYAMYVFELDGQLVALYNFYFVPGTDDLVTIMSVRVRPSFQGQGFGRPEKNPITDQFRRDHPKVTRYIIQTMFKPNIQAKIHQWKQLYHWKHLVYRMTNRQPFQRFPIPHQHQNPRGRSAMMSYTDGTEWLRKSDKLVNFLSRYADDYIVAGASWIPVRINPTELQKIFGDHYVVVSFAVKDNTSIGGKAILMPETDDGNSCGEDDDVTGFSYSFIYQCKFGVCFQIIFYGDSENDLLSHAHRHVLHYASVTQDDVGVAWSVLFPLTIDLNGLRERLRDGFGEPFELGHFSVNEAIEYMAAFDTPL